MGIYSCASEGVHFYLSGEEWTDKKVEPGMTLCNPVGHVARRPPEIAHTIASNGPRAVLKFYSGEKQPIGLKGNGFKITVDFETGRKPSISPE